MLRLQEQKRKEAEREQKRKYVHSQMYFFLNIFQTVIAIAATVVVTCKSRR